MLIFRCQFAHDDTFTVVCHKNGSWVPDPAQYRCISQKSGTLILIIITCLMYGCRVIVSNFNHRKSLRDAQS